MNGRFQMQGGKNWILPKMINANRFFLDSHWLEIWSNHILPSMGPNGGIVAMSSAFRDCVLLERFGEFLPDNSHTKIILRGKSNVLPMHLTKVSSFACYWLDVITEKKQKYAFLTQSLRLKTLAMLICKTIRIILSSFSRKDYRNLNSHIF